jgi:hypothetical protein
MAVSGSSPSGKSRPLGGRSRVKFFLFTCVVLLSVGFYGGVSATKRALTGPDWMQRVLGIELPPAQQAVVVPPKPVAPPVIAPPVAPMAPVEAPPENHVAATAPASGPTARPAPASPTDPEAFLGRWEITDDVQAGDGIPTKIQSDYLFNADGTGEYGTNGKKMYGLRWVISGDFLTVTYDSEQAPQGDNGAIRMRWSVTPDKTLLTLVPENGKDARATLYAVGPGVYHKK